jgi:hypothetical protein
MNGTTRERLRGLVTRWRCGGVVYRSCAQDLARILDDDDSRAAACSPSLVERAEIFARKALGNQTQAHGAARRTIIEHTQEVVAKVWATTSMRDRDFRELAVAVAWLHDVLEDTAVTAQELLEAGVLPEIVELVQLLTRTGVADRADAGGVSGGRLPGGGAADARRRVEAARALRPLHPADARGD